MVTRRRRGQQLEDAILEAAWEIFSNQGYAEVTMKGVAERAGTGKPVLYRRWKDSDALLADAIAAQVERRMPDPPDTGDLREDLLVLLADIDGVLAELSGSMLTHLAQSFQRGGGPPGDLKERIERYTQALVEPVYSRAVDRGDAAESALTPMLLRLPIDLMQIEYLLTMRSVPPETREQFVDAVLLPALRG